MPTIIDSLVITLGLDPTAFQKGQEAAREALRKTRDEADKSGKAVEKSAKDMHAALGKATQGVLDLAAAFLGGRGVKEFIQDATHANNALGNLSLGLGSSPQLLSAWGMAAERMGGSAGATQASIQTLSDSLTDLRTQGKALPDALFQLEAKSGVNVDFLHGWEKLTVGLAKAASTLAKTDPVAASRFLRQLGIDPNTAQLLIQQGPRMEAYLKTVQRLSPTAKDIQASQGLTNAWATLSQQFSQLATKIATAIAPMLTLFAEKLGAVVEGISRFVEAYPNLTMGFAAFFTILTGAKILSSIKNILALRTALLSLSAANTASSSVGLLGLLGRLGIVGAAAVAGAGVADIYEHSSAGEGEDEIARQKRYGQSGGRQLGGNDALRRRGSGGDTGPISDTQGKLNKEDVAAYIRESAIKHGIDPDIALRVARSEGLNKYIGDGNSSFGPFQLHYGGINPSMPHPGIGDDFTKATGLNARDPATVRQQIDFAMNSVRRGGWGPWSGARAQGIVGFRGVGPMPPPTSGSVGDADYRAHRGGNVPMPANMPPKTLWKGIAPPPVSPGAAHAAALNNISNDNRATTSTTSNAAHINTLNVNAPQATDAHGIAKHIDAALAHNMFASYANFGPG